MNESEAMTEIRSRLTEQVTSGNGGREMTSDLGRVRTRGGGRGQGTKEENEEKGEESLGSFCHVGSRV